MKRMIFVLSAALLGGCAVHEWPEPADYSDAPFVLELDFSTEMPLYREVVYTRGETTVTNPSRAEQPPHDVRYTVNVYRAESMRSAATRVAEKTFVFTRPESENLDQRLELPLDEGTYTFYVWTDYVDAGSQEDKYYDTSDFSAITLTSQGHHAGSNDRRDAFRGSVTATVVHPDRWTGTDVAPDDTAVVQMERPMGRYDVISTDVDLFLERVAAMMQQAADGDVDRAADTAAGGETAADTAAGGASAGGIDLNDFRVKISYNMYMPCSYNIFTDKGASSWTGVTFESTMALREEGMSLGYDYIFVDDETLMNIRVEVYGRNDELLSSVSSVEVPIVRSRRTVVKGEFLTSHGAGGVTVNPDFDGPDYNVEIF